MIAAYARALEVPAVEFQQYEQYQQSFITAPFYPGTSRDSTPW